MKILPSERIKQEIENLLAGQTRQVTGSTIQDVILALALLNSKWVALSCRATS